MFSFLSKKLQKNFIDCFAPVPLSACRIKKRYLLERVGISDLGTAIMLAVPYYTAACNDRCRNVSAYAVSRDYHRYFDALFAELITDLKAEFPDYKFAGFADHSPIDEIDAAAKAGLGLIGQNHLLITPKYSSYVFLGEIITDAQIDCGVQRILFCQNCGVCQANCPMKSDGVCLSALTQKKGVLSEAEAEHLRSHTLVWGCDACQKTCPYTKQAVQSGSIYSPIPYFQNDTLSYLNVDMLEKMSDEAFSLRAYSWRGKDVVRRNLLLHEASPKEGEKTC